MATEKELNVNLLRELHHVLRIKRVAEKDGATMEEVLEAICHEEEEIKEMLYQSPPLVSGEK